MNKRTLFAGIAAMLATFCIGTNNNTYADAEYTVNTYTDLKTRIESATANEPTTIKLGSDMTIGEQITLAANKDITIDGQGHTLTQTADYLGSFIDGVSATDSNLSIKNLTLHGAAGPWEAKWDERTETQGGKEYKIPYIKYTSSDEVANKTSERLIYMSTSQSFSLDNVTFDGFASNTGIFYSNTWDFSMKNTTLSNNYIENYPFSFSPRGTTARLTFSNNNIDGNLMYRFAGFDDRIEIVDLSNNRLANNWFYDAEANGIVLGMSLHDGSVTNFNGLEMSNNSASAVLMRFESSCSDSVCPTINIDSLAIVNNTTMAPFAMMMFSNTDVNLKNTEISGNHLKMGGIYGATAFASARGNGLSMTSVKITDNVTEGGALGDIFIAENEISAMPGGAGLTIVTQNNEKKTRVSVDTTSQIARNSASIKGFGDDLVLAAADNKNSDNVELVGFENIADWYLDNADDRYNPASPAAFTDFMKLDTDNFVWTIEGHDYNALGLKAILPEPDPDPDPDPGKNPNTVDNFTIISVISVLSITVLAGISLKTAKARR